MEILQENKQYRLILERHGNKNSVEIHHRKTGMSQTMWHDPTGFPSNAMAELRKSYKAYDINKLAALYDRAGVERVKIYKEGV